MTQMRKICLPCFFVAVAAAVARLTLIVITLHDQPTRLPAAPMGEAGTPAPALDGGQIPQIGYPLWIPEPGDETERERAIANADDTDMLARLVYGEARREMEKTANGIEANSAVTNIEKRSINNGKDN